MKQRRKQTCISYPLDQSLCGRRQLSQNIIDEDHNFIFFFPCSSLSSRFPFLAFLFLHSFEKTFEVNTGAEVRFFRTQSIKPIPFLKINVWVKCFQLPDTSSVQTSSAVNCSNIWLWTKYSQKSRKQGYTVHRNCARIYCAQKSMHIAKT